MAHLEDQTSTSEETNELVFGLEGNIKAPTVSSIVDTFGQDEYVTSKVDINQFEYSITTRAEDKRECFELVNEVYLSKGYLKERDYRKVINKYDKQASTVVVAARDKSGRVVGTISIVLNEIDLPSYEAFPEETKSIRDKSVAEVTRLAISEEYRSSRHLLTGLFWFVIAYSYQTFKCDHTLIEVNPRHAGYYKRYIFFKQLSGERSCERVENAPAILLTLDWDVLIKVDQSPHLIKNLKRSFFKDYDSQRETLEVIKEDILSVANANALSC